MGLIGIDNTSHRQPAPANLMPNDEARRMRVRHEQEHVFRRRRLGAAAVIFAAGTTAIFGGPKLVDVVTKGPEPAKVAATLNERLEKGEVLPISIRVVREEADMEPDTPSSVSQAVEKAHELDEKGKLVEPGQEAHILNQDQAEELLELTSGHKQPIANSSVIVGYTDRE